MDAIRTCSRIFGICLAGLLAAPAAFAQDKAEKADPNEAARHFDRGYLLAQQGSLEAAIAEFKQAYALSPHPSVLYNLGQAYAASGRAVDAVQTLRKYLEQADPKQDSERRAQAAAVVDYQGQRIGTLKLDVEPAGAEITLDGELLGKAPLAAPVQLTAGPHGLTVAAAGYTVRSLRVEIVGKVASATQVKLEPSGSLTRLRVRCAVPDVTVSGEGVASTRLERGGELALAAPPAELRFERLGFLTSTQPVPADTSKPIDCGLTKLDANAKLVPVAIDSPTTIDVRLDGQRFRQGKLPLGRHALALSGKGIENSEHIIEIGATHGNVALAAREAGETLVDERSAQRRLQLTLAIATSAAGVVSLGAAGVIYAINQPQYREWRQQGSQLASDMANNPGEVSAADWNALLEDENALRNRDAAALGLTVLGGALLATGAVLWLTAPQPATSGVTVRIGKTSFVGYSAPF
jgi:hypothetical protein